MPTLPKTFLTPEEYLEIERKAETKSEYFQGEMFPMGTDTPGDRPRRPGTESTRWRGSERRTAWWLETQLPL